MSAPAAHLAWAQVIARNIVPFFGIVFLGWSAASVLVLYFVDTLLSIAVLFAGVLRSFAPPITNDGLAARLNGEVGMLGGGAFLAVAVSVPLGVPLIFMLAGGDTSWRALLDDPALQAGIVWQLVAAFWSYIGLYRALRHATPDELRLKRRFALVFLRWMAMVMVAYLGIGMLLGRYGALAFVVLYAVVSIWSEIAPDRFLRAIPGGVEDADPAPGAARRPVQQSLVARVDTLHQPREQRPVAKRRRRKR
jgi:hypothetical protein